MPNSMTAFARAEYQQPWGTLTWEIRSVNHRYLETGFRMPETLRDCEMELRQAARNTLARGKLDCSLQLTLNRDQEGVNVNNDKAAQYIEATQKVAQLMANPAPVSPIDILKWPGVLEQKEVDTTLVKKAATGLFQQALDQLNENRAIEGDKLKQFILQRVNGIRIETVKVRDRVPQILAAQRQKLQDRAAELAVTLDSERLEQEIVLLAQKSDVDEELDRLGAHLEEIERVLNSRESIGRRLDFLMQELNREANTLSSKSIAIDTTQSAVELKVLIEQMREQIQNIE